MINSASENPCSNFWRVESAETDIANGVGRARRPQGTARFPHIDRFSDKQISPYRLPFLNKKRNFAGACPYGLAVKSLDSHVAYRYPLPENRNP
ncbi:MAG: hypothetical protein IJY03_06780 [Prevotella sp.]|nr:hypothetical protein [Prevotella sp.]